MWCSEIMVLVKIVIFEREKSLSLLIMNPIVIIGVKPSRYYCNNKPGIFKNFVFPYICLFPFERVPAEIIPKPRAPRLPPFGRLCRLHSPFKKTPMPRTHTHPRRVE
uniref:(northern house mosquito) hypothetical protein n=1 Tax=Culex pipiens TaxID=7175 RepID=A0A8D8B7T3_CULPI